VLTLLTFEADRRAQIAQDLNSSGRTAGRDRFASIVRRAVIAMLLAVGCSGGNRAWQPKIEAAVEAICKCPDVACVDREAKGWWDLPWPDLRGASRETHERSIELSRRGSRCQLGKYAQAEIAQVVAWSARTCACTASECANAVDDEIVAWLRKMEQDPPLGPILEYARDAILEHDRCYAKLAGAPAAPPAPAARPDGVAQRVAAAADLVCACATMVCADLVDYELVDGIDSRYSSSVDEPTTGMVLAGPAKDANARFQRCHVARSAKWPHKSRLLGKYGIDP
jgi:hypothetical protein